MFLKRFEKAFRLWEIRGKFGWRAFRSRFGENEVVEPLDFVINPLSKPKITHVVEKGLGQFLQQHECVTEILADIRFGYMCKLGDHRS